MTLLVTPNPVAADARFDVRLSGLHPGQSVTLRSGTSDDNDLLWEASATFEADAHGGVALATQAPHTGSYHVADPMGLVWSALPPDSDTHYPGFYVASVTLRPLTISAEVAGRMVARIDVTRTLLTPAITMTQLNDQGLSGVLLQPTGAASAPGVLVFGGSEGDLNPYVVREATLLATHGFAALALAYFGSPSLRPVLENIPLEYFGKALDWLKGRPGVGGDRLAVMGTSRGGELALLLGATYPEIEAVVSYVGGGVVYPGLPDVTKPAWTFRGKSLPFVPGFLPLQDVDPASFLQAAIPVERINGPVMLLAADDDQIWPSTYLSQLAWNRLRQHAHPYPDEFHHYPNAGHLIQPPYLPTAQDLDQFGGTQQGMAAADADSWPRVLAMLKTRLMR